MPRIGKISRKTGETDIRVEVNLDGSGSADISTGIGFFDHMLTALAKHSLIDLTVEAKGDLHVDQHHLVEDTGICIGEALAGALGDKQSIHRFGWAFCPMDEALTRVVIDLGGRPHFIWQFSNNLTATGEFQSETVPEFFQALAIGSKMNLHMDLIRGRNLHHCVESLFKSFAKALEQAVSISDRATAIPSTKGVL